MMRRYARTEKPVSALPLPRLGFLFFIAAAAIVYSPRLRQWLFPVDPGIAVQSGDTNDPAMHAVVPNEDNESRTGELAQSQSANDGSETDNGASKRDNIDIADLISRRDDHANAMQPSTSRSAENLTTGGQRLNSGPNAEEKSHESVDSDEPVAGKYDAWLTDRAQIESELPDLLGLLTDNSLKIYPREMPAYWRLVKLSQMQSFDELAKQAARNATLNDFILNARHRRGKLFSIDMEVRDVRSYDVKYDNIAGVHRMYEIWGTTPQSRTRMHVVCTTELPAGLEVGTDRAKASVAGYFMKLQGYEPGSAKPGDRPIPAPLFIGKLSNVQAMAIEPPSPATLQGPSFTLIASLFALLTLGILVYIVWILKRPKRLLNAGPTAKPASLDWLDH